MWEVCFKHINPQDISPFSATNSLPWKKVPWFQKLQLPACRSKHCLGKRERQNETVGKKNKKTNAWLSQHSHLPSPPPQNYKVIPAPAASWELIFCDLKHRLWNSRKSTRQTGWGRNEGQFGDERTLWEKRAWHCFAKRVTWKYVNPFGRNNCWEEDELQAIWNWED